MNKTEKIFSALIPVVILSMIVYFTALLLVTPAHASEPIVFANVSIEDGSMAPLSLNLNENLKIKIIDKEKDEKEKHSTSTERSIDEDSHADLPTHMSTMNDLRLYTRSLEQEDRDIENVEMQDDHIVLAYRQPAKFLGLVPVSVIANVKVDAQGNVSVDYPWYTVLSFKNDAKLKEELRLKVAEVIHSGNAAGTATGTTTITFSSLSTRSRAKILQAIHIALKNNVKAKMNDR